MFMHGYIVCCNDVVDLADQANDSGIKMMPSMKMRRQSSYEQDVHVEVAVPSGTLVQQQQ